MDRRQILTAGAMSAAALWLPSSDSAASGSRPPAVARTARWFVDALDTEGVAVIGVGDWSRHNRNHKGRWGPPAGVMIHHTASRGQRASIAVVRDGRHDLPGPLSHGVIAKSGAVYLTGYGRTNHAGLGDARVLRAVRREAKLPRPMRWDADGNPYFYGFECINAGTGRDPWPPEQIEAIVRVSAALCRYHGWGANRVVGHKEWQRGKIDPKGFSMNTLRSRIAHRLYA